MKASRKWFLVIVLAVVLPLGAAFTVKVAAPVWRFVQLFREVGDRARRGREHLFYDTDYQELLAACRELLRRVDSGDLQPGQYSVHLGGPDPEVSSFPQVILELEPALVLVHGNGFKRVDVELMPGPDSWGVWAYCEGHEGSGDARRIEGLWYYDSDYRDEYPDYMEKIASMIEEGRRLKAARARTRAVEAAVEPVAQ